MNFLKELIEAYKVSHNPLFDSAFYGMMYVLLYLPAYNFIHKGWKRGYLPNSWIFKERWTELCAKSVE
ncbi:MAG: hypothetical protein RR268_07050, partial [Kiritimatiellia bacterium]